MFGHRQFLSSFWILEITRFTVSSIRSSLGLWVRDLDFRPHMVLASGSCWSFFIGFTPVQQSSQEYLGVLVHDPVWWISRNILKRNPKERCFLKMLHRYLDRTKHPILDCIYWSSKWPYPNFCLVYFLPFLFWWVAAWIGFKEVRNIIKPIHLIGG
jgi:hypothetical protein